MGAVFSKPRILIYPDNSEAHDKMVKKLRREKLDPPPGEGTGLVGKSGKPKITEPRTENLYDPCEGDGKDDGPKYLHVLNNKPTRGRGRR